MYIESTDFEIHTLITSYLHNFLQWLSQECYIHKYLLKNIIFTKLFCYTDIPYIANCLRWKSFVDGQGTSYSLENFHSSFTQVKMCSRAYSISLIKCTCLIILNNYMYLLTCCFLSLADIARQCGCKIVSSWKLTQCTVLQCRCAACQPRGHVKSY